MSPDLIPIHPASPNSPGVEIAPGVHLPEAALRFQFARGGGPGGQNVNKVNTKAELWVDLADLVLTIPPDALQRLVHLAGRKLTKQGRLHFASEIHRSQEQNRQETLLRLRELLIEAMHRPKVRRKTKPSRGSKQRRLDSKRRRGDIKKGRQGRE